MKKMPRAVGHASAGGACDGNDAAHLLVVPVLHARYLLAVHLNRIDMIGLGMIEPVAVGADLAFWFLVVPINPNIVGKAFAEAEAWPPLIGG